MLLENTICRYLYLNSIKTIPMMETLNLRSTSDDDEEINSRIGTIIKHKLFTHSKVTLTYVIMYSTVKPSYSYCIYMFTIITN